VGGHLWPYFRCLTVSLVETEEKQHRTCKDRWSAAQDFNILNSVCFRLYSYFRGLNDYGFA